MRWVVAVALVIGASPQALACNAEMLAVQSWDAKANERNRFFPVDLAATVEYRGSRPYRMIHAGVMFSDALGGNLGQINLARDQSVAPGDILNVDGLVEAKERLLKINRDDVVTRTCVWSIVYEDGTVEKFE